MLLIRYNLQPPPITRFTLSAPELHAAVGAPIRAFLALEPIVFQIVSIFANLVE